MNTYRLFLCRRDGAVAQVSEIECPDDDFAAAFAAERRRVFARAELWLDQRLVARVDGEGELERDAIIVPPFAAGPAIGAGE